MKTMKSKLVVALMAAGLSFSAAAADITVAVLPEPVLYVGLSLVWAALKVDAFGILVTRSLLQFRVRVLGAHYDSLPVRCRT